jgi:cysteine-rich repeat protein
MRLLSLLGLCAFLAACGSTTQCTDLDDNNPCTDDFCLKGVTRHTPSTAATRCATGVCDGIGQCVECLGDRDCTAPRVCAITTHSCTLTAGSCTDGLRTGDETGVDCGGSCAPAKQCALGGGCAANTDCVTGLCTSGACAAARCGDGVQQPNEACDDGNATNGDGCDDGAGGSCRPTGCGNGTRTGTEACDDGNAVNADGCDTNCTVTRCGNGIAGGTETCDDGNTMAGDGCSAGCRVEMGYVCMNMPSMCLSTCGDGALSGTEECDDGNRTGGDGCSMNCFRETGFACTGAPSTCTTTCGDGFRAGTEGCDDMNVTAGDGCSATCTVESGFQCAGTPSRCVSRCGDGVKLGTEACDDGNTTPGDGCSPTCTIDPGYVCSGMPSVCLGNCGDGLRQTGEGCDDHNLVPGDGCSATCAVESGFSCTMASPSVCASVCGDGIKAASETCDDANVTAGDGCSASCTIEAGYSCTGTMPSTCVVVCGDGAKAASEGCDDGNVAAGDGCSATCAVESNFACTGTNPSVCRGVCGDGVIVQGEACDDANATSGNGCSATCQVEFGFVCTGTPSVCTATCGDGLKASTEGCDDGNTMSGNGCSSTCTVEAGWTCTGTMPTTCVMRAATCGDGFTDAPEQCDDGNTRALDGCGANCRFERTEVEPNEDGTPQTGGSTINGNDFNATAVTNANANGGFFASGGNTAVLAALNPAGDEDVFAVVNDTVLPQDVAFETWNRAAGFGQGVACGTSIDLAMQLRDLNGVSLASNDDRNGSSDRCSSITFTLAPGQKLYAHVSEYGDDAIVPAYGLEFRFTPVICGDGVVRAPYEECDDGNQVNTDACSNTCTFNAVSEVEPNNTTAQAAASTVQVTGTTLLRGALTPATDLDVYRVTVAAPTVLRLETFTTPGDCASGVTTTLRLFDSAGTQLVTDATTGIASCSAIVYPVPAGTFYVQVEETGTNATVAGYFLDVVFNASGGNEGEAVNVSGTNNTIATSEGGLVSLVNGWGFGDHTVSTDVDVWAITVPAGKAVRAEIVEGNTAKTCEALGIDSRLTLYNSAGTQLVDDDDTGRGFCSLIDGTGTSPVNAAAKNTGTTTTTMYLMVRGSSLGSAANLVFQYRLQVTIR